MNPIIVVLWIVAGFFAAIYLYVFLYPYLRTKIKFYIYYRRTKKAASKMGNIEIKSLMEEVAEGCKRIYKDKKL